ncbi:Acyl-CoA N-acyltransferase [Hirsutella rhossiliensis]|uniref:Acyl-CoA N-acyltransferase n=1 Tax=Hirsutella rhossiliensis TaxID=111463 RepID=A0A9P8N342_9HYPO|nr:Acyl-CoA N-acyltransferase [Hirsutella rhossiliensis]KAH0965965.1 Acyl-CoA N-acyltransferase [Hirsutella rhossiliensis]
MPAWPIHSRRPPDDDIERHCGAMRDWLAPSFSPQQLFQAPASPVNPKPSQQRSASSHLAPSELKASATSCKVEPTSDRHGLLAQAPPFPGLEKPRGHTSDQQAFLAAEDTTPEMDETFFKHANSESSRGQPIVKSPAAARASIHQGPQRSISTWDVSDIEVETGEKAGSITVDPHGVASLRDAGLEFEATGSPLSARAEEDELIGGWFKGLVTPPAAAYRPFKVSLLASCQHELDSCTGKFLPAIEYPETLQSAIQGPYRDHKDIGWRQMNMTSGLQIVRELTSRQRLAEHLLASRQQTEEAMAAVAAPYPEEDAWPNAHCILRPARQEDFSQIANIINLEGSTAAFPQIFDSKVIDSTDVDWISKRCQQTIRPFIVAVPMEEDMMDRSKWPPNSDRAYREYIEFKKTRPSPPPPIVGFALVTEVRLGFPQLRCPGSRYSAQVRVLVHPEYRQKSYGTALLDRILLSLSPRHRSIIDYEWKCANPARIYEHPVDRNGRQYARLYVEVFCASKVQTEYKWRAEMLSKFNFQEVAHLRDAIKTDQGHQSKWLDLVLWEFAAQETSAIREGTR